MTMTDAEIEARRTQRSTQEASYVNTLNVHGRVTIDFVWYPGAVTVDDSLIDTFVTDHPRTGNHREITYTWTPEGGTPIVREMRSGRITLPLALGGRGTLSVFGTEWEITRQADGVNMAPVDELLGVKQRLDRLGYHLRKPGAEGSGVDGPLRRRTEHAILCFQADYQPTGSGPPRRLQVRGEWTQNPAAQYQSNLTEYNNHVTAPNPSAADGEAFRRALAAYVGS